MKTRISPEFTKPSAFWGRTFSTPAKPAKPNLPFSELGSQSNTNSESSKPTVLRVGTNQTQPKSISKYLLERTLMDWTKTINVQFPNSQKHIENVPVLSKSNISKNLLVAP